MPKSLVIVESPAKAKTVNRYLGRDYLVKASMGHVRDLPKEKLGIEIENDFKPHYVIIPEKKKIVHELKKWAKKCESVVLAADPDREGEAICWHLSHILKDDNKKVYRTLLHEITKRAVEEAFKNLGQLDQYKINAQQTRRMLDRLVGYLISPLLWKKIGRGLSAGRVQSVALRLICEREREIKDFVPEEFWTVTARLEASKPPSFKAVLTKIEDKKVKIKNGREAEKIVEELKQALFVVHDFKIKEKKKNPYPPYITSTLQQDSFRLLRFPVKKTMAIAQRLYEGLKIGDRGLVGLITYMRTDSVRISNLALFLARKYIGSNFPSAYLPPNARIFKNKRKAQDAHEAVRPTSLDLAPEVVKPYLKNEEYSLYNLIWKKFIASQMSSALVEETEFDIRASKYQFQSKGEVIKFDGFLTLYLSQRKEEDVLPKVERGEELTLLELEPKQNFTQPPPRYTEGTLVKELETRGIGRPSTYAPIIATLQDRVYVIKEKGKFIPTEIGIFVTDFLVKNFPDLMKAEFTASMEEELDRISEGEQDWQESLRNYYKLLDRYLEDGKKLEGIRKKGIPVDETCPQCSRRLVIREGRYGRFKACSGYPDCNYRESFLKKEIKSLEEKCPQCGSQLVLRKGKYGSFIACSGYPECKFTKKESIDTGIFCPLNCGGKIVSRKTKKGKIFFGCSNFPKCDFATWDEPIHQSCPGCGREFVLRKNQIRGEPYLYCSNEECNYKENVEKEKIWDRKGPAREEEDL
ncbi:MAG: type I DNA topoisomerase [Candidatus Aminicenantaceae bacterium]